MKSVQTSAVARVPGVSFGRIAGIEIRADWSVLIIFLLIAFSLATSLFPRWHPGWGPAVMWSTAFAAATFFLLSVLVHELAHGLVGRAQGVSIRGITLFLFGGIAHMDNPPSTPKAEFLMAIVGPITSIVIGGLAIALGNVWTGGLLASAATRQDPALLLDVLRSLGPFPTLLLWLGPINVMLGLFNLVPGFPLDGGRLLRSVLWAVTHDFEKATRWATFGGQLVGWGLMAFGVLDVLSGFLVQGLWLLLIGWFLNNAARLSYEQVLTRKALSAVSVARMMRTDLDRVSADMSLEDLVANHLLATDQVAFPVEAEDGTLLGLVTADDVRKVVHGEWPQTTVATVMTRADALSTLPPDAPAQQAFEEIMRQDVEQIPILEGHHLVGLVRRHDLVRWIALQRPPVLT